MLWLDEVAALFGNRSAVGDSHNRRANIEISCFPQRMEAHDWLAIQRPRGSATISSRVASAP